MELLKKEIENINLRKKNTRKKVENLIEKKSYKTKQMNIMVNMNGLLHIMADRLMN